MTTTTKPDQTAIAELEKQFEILICPGASRWQAFREGNSTVGYGDTPAIAVEDWRSKQRPWHSGMNRSTATM